jgi:peptide chain release factor subunit 3
MKLEEQMEQTESSEEQYDPREPINLVFIGHVDAGKSTICGNIL